MTANLFGKVYLVGAGPGDPELITVKGKRCIELADVILYDELANRVLLDLAAANTELIYVGKKAGRHCIAQRDIEAHLVHYARAGKTVVRLKGGDPFVFGRGGEEAQALQKAGVPFEIVPGVSSITAVPAYAGIPLTHRDCAASFAVVTGHRARGEQNWGELARGVDTLVILMGLQHLGTIIGRLLAEGCQPDKPVALIESGTRKRQRKVVGTVSTIVERASRSQLRSPTLIVIGAVVELGRELEWLNDCAHSNSLPPARASRGACLNIERVG